MDLKYLQQQGARVELERLERDRKVLEAQIAEVKQIINGKPKPPVKHKVKRIGGKWTPAMRKAAAERTRAYWEKVKAAETTH